MIYRNFHDHDLALEFVHQKIYAQICFEGAILFFGVKDQMCPFDAMRVIVTILSPFLTGLVTGGLVQAIGGDPSPNANNAA